MTLVIVHHHFRPGGVRRVIELGAPHIAAALRPAAKRILLLTGEAPDAFWLAQFRDRVGPAVVHCVVEPALGYVSEQRRSPPAIRRRIRKCLAGLMAASDDIAACWAHNLGLGRNLILSVELTRACARRGIPLVLHHHDWWFENRWQRWPEFRRTGFHTLADAGWALFPADAGLRHVSINRTDARLLRKHLPGQAAWIPNLAEFAPTPPPARVRRARHWLSQQLGDNAPVWLVPCRFLRRKNLAEALLLTRWLRPDAWLVTTGTPSSAEESSCFHTLERAARHHRWPLRLAVLEGDESTKPTVPELQAASEAILLTSLQEGFGLPFLEAVRARRPLIGRRLPNVAPDLHLFGFRFPQLYDEVFIAPDLFDADAELTRQERRFADWRRLIPAVCRKWVDTPPWFEPLAARATIPFSRLTLTAQIEVLAHPAPQSWEVCAPLNPRLRQWQPHAAKAALQVTSWPRSAERWLGPAAYAARFVRLLKSRASAPPRSELIRLPQAFLREKLDTRWLYPLLWSTSS